MCEYIELKFRFTDAFSNRILQKRFILSQYNHVLEDKEKKFFSKIWTCMMLPLMPALRLASTSERILSD